MRADIISRNNMAKRVIGGHKQFHRRPMYSRSTFIRINWDGQPSEYAENADNWNFLLKIIYIGSLQFGCYYLQYVPASKPFDHVWFEVLEAVTLYRP